MQEVLEELAIRKYSAYKDSGVEGLGKIPRHWVPLSNKYIFSIKKNQVGKKSANFVLLSLTLGGVIKRDMENPQGKFPAEFNTYQEVKTGDFIFCLFDVEETPRAVGLSDFDGMITGAYTVMESNSDQNKNYLYWFFLNLDSDKRLRHLYTGLRNIISKENFLSFKIPIPPLSEQTAIARFLARKTALIEKAIAIKEKHIELLKERRQILIQNAVTRGLNPNAKMMDSGVEWIGEVPNGWRIMKLSYSLSLLVDGTHFSPKSHHEGEFKYITAKNVKEEGFDFTELGYIDERAHNVIYSRCPVRRGDVLYIKDGATAGVAMINDLDEQFSLLSSVAILRPREHLINNTYLRHYLNSELIKGYVQTQIVGGAITRLTLELISSFKIIVPPLEQQELISKSIDEINLKIRATISLKKKEIERLQEFKSTLINGAVTGKIKVC
jgi:type I restriction enzyme S subunit